MFKNDCVKMKKNTFAEKILSRNIKYHVGDIV